FPQAKRRLLTRWSDIAVSEPGFGIVDSWESRRLELEDCFTTFAALWQERLQGEPRSDLLSLMVHAEGTKNLSPGEFLGNLINLIVGGNDTTRNSISGGVLALNQNPGEYDKLRANPDLITGMVPEIIRWQTPLAHMRRTATSDIELGAKTIKKGDKVVMWYVSGNRDGEVIENPNAFIIDRERPRQHLSFGFGIHRCVGNRLAELQLKIVWEEVMKRWRFVEVVGEPKRVRSSFVKGYETLPVRIQA
ncbi:MAG: cytochrome P450, partial [Micropepsaceae bacterium]